MSRGQSDEHTSRYFPLPSSPRTNACAIASTSRADNSSIASASAVRRGWRGSSSLATDLEFTGQLLGTLVCTPYRLGAADL